MKQIEKRLHRLEQKSDPNRITTAEITLIDTREQVQHPERFRKVLESEIVGSSGNTRKVYGMERINE